MNNSITVVSLSAIFLVFGCHVGPQIEDLDLAHNPEGATVEVQVSQSESKKTLVFDGELLEIREDGVVFAGRANDESVRRVTFVPWHMAYRVRATAFSGYYVRAGKRLDWDEDTKSRFRLISRFPQGIAPDVMQGLLAAHNQKELDSLAD